MNEIITSRVFEKDIATVYKAWTIPEQLQHWWGPHGFTNTFLAFDLRPGGRWSMVMHGPDGNDYKNEMVFDEIIPNQLLSFTYALNHKIKAATTFEQLSDNTTLVNFKMIFYNPEEFDALKSFIAEKNAENLERLQRELTK